MSGSDGKRRLPLAPRVEVKEPEDEDRPPWHWAIGIGPIGVFVLWLPLAMLVNGVLHASTGALGTALNATAFALACFGSGLLLGRFGAKAGRKEAAISGVVAAFLTSLIVLVSGPAPSGSAVLVLALLLAVLAAIGAGASWLGAWLGVRLRAPYPPSPLSPHLGGKGEENVAAKDSPFPRNRGKGAGG